MNAWIKVPLSKVAEVFNGKTPSKGEQREIGHPVLKIRDVSELGTFRGSHESFVDPLLAQKYSAKQVRASDTLVLNAAHNADYVGSKTYRAESSVVGALATGEWLVIRPISEKLDPNFVHHWVTSRATKLAIRNAVTGIHLYPKDVARLHISLPVLPEQRRIAAILDQADALIAKRREALAQVDSLTQSIFIEMFGDPVTNSKHLPSTLLTQIATFENGDRSGNYPSGDDIREDGVLFLSTKNITDGRLDLTKSAYITEEKFNSLSRGKARRHDLIVTLRGTLGRCCIFDTTHDTAFINAQMMIIRPHPACNSIYLHALLTSQQAQERFEHIGRGAAIPQLTSAQMACLQIPLPSLPEQQEFARRKKALDDLRGTQEKAKTELENLFASLQHRAFRGEL